MIAARTRVVLVVVLSTSSFFYSSFLAFTANSTAHIRNTLGRHESVFGFFLGYAYVAIRRHCTKLDTVQFFVMVLLDMKNV